MTLGWDEESERTLAMFCGMVPETYRELARATAREEAEIVAGERGTSSVTPDDVVRGWIRTTPPEQRDGLVAVIDQSGFDPLQFADELGSAEGWDEESTSEEG